MEELQKENEMLLSEKCSIIEQIEEVFTKHMGRVPTPTSRSKEQKLLSSLTRIYYEFETDLENAIITWGRNGVSELKKSTQTVSHEWKGRCKGMEET